MNSESCPSLVWLVSQLSEQTSGSISSCSPSLCKRIKVMSRFQGFKEAPPDQRDVGSNPEGKTLPGLSLRSCVVSTFKIPITDREALKSNGWMDWTDWTGSYVGIVKKRDPGVLTHAKIFGGFDKVNRDNLK